MKKGDKVNLGKNSGTNMIVSKINDNETVVCQWISKSTEELQTHIFDKYLLETSGKGFDSNKKINVEVGQIVNLNLGSVKIQAVIQKVIDDETVICQWISNSTEELQTEEVQIFLLSKYSPMAKNVGLEMSY